MMLEPGTIPGSRVSEHGCGRGRWTVALLGLALCAATPASAVPIHGRVLSAAGRPLSGAEVTLAPMPSALTPDPAPSAPSARTATDAQGDFALDAPGPGLWRLRLQASGSGTVVCDLVPLLDAVEIPTLNLPPAVPVAAASTPRVHCHAEDPKTAAAAAGQVLTLRLLAPDGKPAPGVRAEMEDGTIAGPGDADGRLQVELAGSGPTAARFWSTDGAWAAVLLWPNATEVRLTPPVTLDGTVLDRATRRPLPGALVWPAADPGRAVRSDARGSFALKIPFLAAPALQAAAPGYQVATVRPDREKDLAVSLAPAAAVPGLVVDEAGKPVAGAEVDVISAEAAPPQGEVRGWSRTDASGRFHFDGLEPGERLAARVRASGFAALESTLPPLPTTVRLVVQRGRTVLGKVVDASGRPVPGAEVRAWPADPQARPEDLLRVRDREMRQTAGRDGSFSLPTVAAGQLDLSFRAEGAAPAWLRGVEVPSGSGPLDLGRIVLGPELVLRGTVVDDTGAAIAGAKVTAVPATTLPRPGDLAGEPPHASLTDGDGRFALAGVETGVRLFLRAERDGFLPATQEVQPGTGSDPVLLTLDPAEALRGTVVDEQGGPVEGARIALLTGSRDRLRPLASAMSDRTGAFSIAAAQPGSHHLAVQATGYRAWLQPLTVETGSSQPVEVRLARGAALSGRIVSERGEPVEGAGVSLAMEETAGLVAPGTVSDADGAYRLEGLPDGPQQVRVLHPDYLPVNRQVQLDGDTAQSFTLKAGAALSGQVVDEKGDPVSGATVTVQAETDPVSVPQRWSNAEGRFRVPGLAPARYSVLVELDGYAPAELSGVEIGRDRPDLLVRLTRGATLFGQIHGVPTEERSRLQVWASGPTLVQKAGTVDPEGRYRIESLGAGPWRISARAEGLGREVSAPLSLAPDQRDAFLDLEFTTGYALTGAVTRGGNAVEGALVSVHGVDSAGAVTGPQGRFRIGPLTPGSYQVVVLDRATGASQSWKLDLDNDRETVFELPAPVQQPSQDTRDTEP
jgi:protocatechuate 3,4-dioxygenase beta subunit